MSSNGYGCHQRFATSSGYQVDKSHYVLDRKKNYADTPYSEDSKSFNILSPSSQDQQQRSYLQEDGIDHSHAYEVDDPPQPRNVAEASQTELDSTNDAFDIDDEINPVVCWYLHKDKQPRKYFVKLSQWRYPFITQYFFLIVRIYIRRYCVDLTIII